QRERERARAVQTCGGQDIRDSVPPVLNERLLILTAKLGETVVIPCVAYANPRPHYRWIYQKQSGHEVTLETSERHMVRHGTLVILSVRESDAGTYLCNASNEDGSETLEVQLSVSSPLQVVVQPSRQRVDLGKSAIFHCSISGFPRTSIHWLKDGQPLRINPRVQEPAEDQIHVSAVSKEDRGMYQCFVKNQMEMAQGAGELRLGEVYPQLAYKFIEQTLQPGSSVSLKCSASGNPTPSISWMLDGFPLPHNERMMIGQYVTVFGDVISHVNISQVKPDDGGEYACAAENRAGRTSHAARLNIYDGVRLPTNIRQKVSNGTLRVENVQRISDQGIYSCTAKNKQNYTAQRSVDIRVLVPPKITPFSFARDLNVGDRTSIQCVVVTGDLPLSFVWLKDQHGSLADINTRQYDDFTSTLSIGSISRAHSGNYTCRVSNAASTVTHTAQLRVNVPPRISPFYFEDGVTEGMHTQIMCTASQGDRPFNITWRKDSQPLSDDARWISISDYAPFSSILTINTVTSSHSGNYTCVAANKVGKAEYTAQLSVTVPPQWVMEPMDREVVQGNPVMLQCQVDGFPKPSVTWKQPVGSELVDYRDLSHGRHLHILENGSLLISNATQEHEGRYVCQAGNGIGPGLSKVVKLIVHAGPRFKLPPQEEIAHKGETVSLSCEAEGDQPMDVTWKAKGKRVDSTSDTRYSVKTIQVLQGSQSILTIAGVSPEDRGDFTCIASNAYGQDRASIHLVVQEPPNFPRNLHVVEQTSRSVLLSWSPGAGTDAPITSYIVQYKEASDMWHEYNQQLSVPGDQSVVLVGGLRPAMAYHFRLYAKNALGTSEPSDPLHALTESEIPGGPPCEVSVEATSPDEIHVQWQPPDRHLWNSEQIGYQIGYRKMGPGPEDEGVYNFTRVGAGLEVHLSGLEKFTKYSIIVKAFNGRGDGPSSEALVVQTLEDVPSAPPRDLMCTPVSANDLQVSWHPPDRAHVHGIIQGYKLFYEPVEERYELGIREIKTTSATTAVLHGLKPFTNYSIQVLASTRAGSGVVSPTTYCTTEETVPEAPERVKAVPCSENAAFIGWLPPKRPNGIVTKYTVHLRVLEKDREVKIVKATVAAHQLYYEVTGLTHARMYEAWVTATTRVGQGAGTPIVRLSPAALSGAVPAAIVSFGQLVTVPWKVNVKLDCLFVGVPRASAEWKLGDSILHRQPKIEIAPDNTLIVMNVVRNNEGNYSCRVQNSFGSDEITYFLQVQVPPTPPTLVVTSVMQKAVQLQWKQGDTGGAAVRLFLLAYRSVGEGGEAGEWDELSVEPAVSTRLLEGLVCGTRYQFRLAAVNKIGSGGASSVVDVMTKGSKPEAPKSEHFLLVNTTSVTLLLDAWQDGGCQIKSFTIEYSEAIGRSNWKLVASNISPQPNFILQGLVRGTHYALRVSARNPAGTTVAQYMFVTRSVLPDRRQFKRLMFLAGDGARPPGHNVIASAGDGSDGLPFYMDAQVMIPASISAMAVLAALTALGFCLHRSKNPPPTYFLLSLSSFSDSSRYVYFVVFEDIWFRRIDVGSNIGGGGHAARRGLETGSGLQDSTAALDNKHNAEQRERYYATVCKTARSGLERIPEYSEDIYPYATFHLAEEESMAANPRLQLQSVFGYEGKQCDSEHHLKTRTRGRKSKSHKSESEEYDSLGSDSDTEQGTSSRTESSNRLDDPGPGSGLPRPAHHNFNCNTQESSTSTEPSPISDSTQDHKLSGFGDIHPHELSEAECDIDMDINLARKMRHHGHEFTIAV
ncbi:Down syndrome cell adhesion molecule-like protein Dscam2, partial [Blattella germanica]